jgi:hypothetical protein
MSNASPFRFPELWDSISFGGGAFTWSGKIEIRGASRYYKWQQKNSPGRKGATQTFQATFPKPFTIKFFIWTDSQWTLLPGLLQVFFYDGSKTAPDGSPLIVPVDIYHPQLAMVDIFQVVIDEIMSPEVDQERSGWATMLVKMREFLPPVPASVKTPVAVGPVPTQFVALPNGSGAEIVAQNQAVENLANQLAQPKALP